MPLLRHGFCIFISIHPSYLLGKVVAGSLVPQAYVPGIFMYIYLPFAPFHFYS